MKPEHDYKRQLVKALDSEWYDLTQNQNEMFKVLFEANGAWIGGKALKPSRPDKIIKKMQEPVKALIESHQQQGYRIPSLIPK